MNRKEAAELLPIIEAFSKGEEIETKVKSGWISTDNMRFVDSPRDYRIKKKPKYRPFANSEECWAEMQKHQPFGWVKTKDKGIRLCIVGLNQKNAFTQVGHKYDEALDEFTFDDGTPFGVKVK